MHDLEPWASESVSELGRVPLRVPLRTEPGRGSGRQAPSHSRAPGRQRPQRPGMGQQLEAPAVEGRLGLGAVHPRAPSGMVPWELARLG